MVVTEPDPFAPQPLARWYYIGAVAAFLFMGLMCFAYLGHVTTDPDAIPVDRRAGFLAQPAWVTGAFGLAAFSGLAGAILLLLRRKFAESALLISLISTFAWIAGLALIADVRDVMTVNDWAVLIAAAAIVWTIFWFARHSRQRGWLA